MAHKAGIGREGMRIEVFYPERPDAVDPPHTEFIGDENTFSLVFRENHAELYAHDGFTPGGWLIAGGSISGVAYADCEGVSLPTGSQLVQCDDIVSYSLAILNAGVQVQTITDSLGDKTFKVGGRKSANADNFLTIAADGFMLGLTGCDDLPLDPATAKFPTCADTIVRGELDYELADGGAPEIGDATGLAATDGPHFHWAVLRYYNADDDELFFIDITDALNSIDFAVDISMDAGNIVENRVDGLYVPTPPSVDISISADANNQLSEHLDGLYAAPTSNQPLILNVTADTTLTAAQILATAHSGLIVMVDSETDVTLTVPTDTPIGRSFAVCRKNTGNVIFGSDGVYAQVINSPEGFDVTPRAIFSMVTYLCIGLGSGTTTSEWLAMGDLTQLEG